MREYCNRGVFVHLLTTWNSKCFLCTIELAAVQKDELCIKSARSIEWFWAFWHILICTFQLQFDLHRKCVAYRSLIVPNLAGETPCGWVPHLLLIDIIESIINNRGPMKNCSGIVWQFTQRGLYKPRRKTCVTEQAIIYGHVDVYYVTCERSLHLV